jgi:hypothetical protein
MGFFNLFSAEGRERAKINREYEECFDSYRAKRLSFRTNAINDILFQYPDARVLANRYDPRFMALLKTGEIRVGEFADKYLPRLDYVDDMDSASEKRMATARFRHALSHSTGNISKDMMPIFKKRFSFMDPDGMSLMHKGYRITDTFVPEDTYYGFLVGASLFLNDRKIATASIWDPQPKGYFSGKILERVIENLPIKEGLLKVSMCIVKCNWGGEWTKCGYEFVLGSLPADVDEFFRKEQVNMIINLRDFMYDIQDHIKIEAESLDDFSEIADCQEVSARKALETPSIYGLVDDE